MSDTAVDWGTSLVHTVRRRAQATPAGCILRRMGYAPVRARDIERLVLVLGDDLLGLDDARFDFRYASGQFAEQLCRALSIKVSLSRQGLAQLHARVANRRAFTPYLFVETDFRRTTQPVFVLALMEPYRCLTFGRGFRDLSVTAQVDRAGELARSHYDRNKGVLPVWGPIQEYRFYQAADRVVVLNARGALIHLEGTAPGTQAEIELGHRKMPTSWVTPG